jgi:hypothetical protein
MKIDRSLIGWIVAAVLLAALAGVLIYNASTDEESQPAALGGGTQGQPVPGDVAEDVAEIQDNKPQTEDHSIPAVPAGQTVRELAQNPPRKDCDPDRPSNAFAEWENNPRNLSQATTMADQIVVGMVTGAQRGQAYTTAVQGEPGGQVSYPTQNVTIRVSEAVKGAAREGGVVTVERLGDAAGCFRVEGEPAYVAGQQYLLLLENGRGGRPSHVISPAGRYQVTANNSLRAVEHTSVSDDLAGQKLNQVVNRLQAG